MRKFWLLLMPVLLLVGCVTADTTSFVDPEYSASGYKISKVIVKADSSSLEETLSAETALIEEFGSLGIDAIKYIDLVPPTRDYDSKEIARIISNTSADSLFIAMAGHRSAVESHVPITYHATRNTFYISGGYTESAPTMSAKSQLIDLDNGNIVWQAESSARGEDFYLHDYTDLLVAAGKDAIEDLQIRGFID